MKGSDDQILRRLHQTANFRAYRKKVHNLRRLVAGDVSVIDSYTKGSQDTEMSAVTKGITAGEFFDIIVTDIEEGRTNKLLQAVRTLHFQTTKRFPDLEAEDLDAQLAALNAIYFKVASSRSEVLTKVARANLDYLVGGLGCNFVGTRDGIPVVDYVDALDVLYDLTASSFSEIRWGARVIRLPLYQWLELFPKKEALTKLQGTGGSEDIPVGMYCYHDRTGIDSGNEVYYLINGSDDMPPAAENLIHRGKNLYTEFVGGEERTCVPLVFMHYMQLPSVRVPVSTVEMMLPAQIALWETDRAIRDHIAIGGAHREMEQGSYTDESLEAWKDGDKAIILERVTGKPAMHISPALDIPQGQVLYRQNNEQEIIGQSGVDPYANGQKVEGISYASEVNAIRGAAGLVAKTVSQDTADFWQRLAKRFISNGARMHEGPITLKYRDQNRTLSLVFDESNPIGQYLVPDADFVISEDGISHRPKDQKIQMALADLQLAMTPAIMQMYPNFLNKATEEYLRAKDFKNITEWMEPPKPMAIDPMAMGGADSAMASSAA